MSDKQPPVVTADDKGIRTNWESDACSFCQQKVGQRHRTSCVIWTRPVKLRLVVEYSSDEPVSFTPEFIRFRYNEATYCMDNLLDMLTALAEAHGCLCSAPGVSIEYVSEIDTDV